MRGIVKSKPFVKKIRRQKKISSWFSFYRSWRRWQDHQSPISLFLKKWWLLVFATFLLFVLWLFLLKWTWYNPVYLIKTIEYTQETKNKYWNTELFVLSSKFLRGKYYNALRVWWESQLVDWVRTEYPFVRSADINFLGDQKISVDFDFYEPEFLVKIWEKRYWVWWENVSDELDVNWSLWKDAFVVDTPAYAASAPSIAWFFYEIWYDWYKNNLPLIQEAFPRMTRFVYLVGSQNFIVFEDGKMIYLYKDNVLHQIDKLQKLQKYYEEYKNLATVDLWSLTQDKVIVWWW